MQQGAWGTRNYQEPNGSVPVEDFLRELNATGAAKGTARIIQKIALLREFGLGLGTEHLHKIPATDLWELVATWNRNPYRVLFFDAGGGMLILLSAFHKKTNAIPQAEIDLALRRMEDHRRRHP